MGLSNLKGNGGYIGIDKRGSITGGSIGSMSIRKYYLERLGANLTPPDSGPGNDVSVWYDASNNYILTSGSDVIRWDDRSGNDIYLDDSGSGDRPTYNTIDSDFNNHPSLTFNNNNFMESIYKSNLDVPSDDGFTLYIVIKINSFPSTYSFATTRTNGTSWTQGFGMMYFASNWRFWVNNYNFTNTRADMGSWSDFTNAHIFKLMYDRVNVTGEIIGPSGVSEVLTPYTTVVKNPSTSEGLRLGDGNSSSYDLSCKIAEYAFYNRSLDSNEQNEAENYLKNKFNIS